MPTKEEINQTLHEFRGMSDAYRTLVLTNEIDEIKYKTHFPPFDRVTH